MRESESKFWLVRTGRISAKPRFCPASSFSPPRLSFRVFLSCREKERSLVWCLVCCYSADSLSHNTSYYPIMAGRLFGWPSAMRQSVAFSQARHYASKGTHEPLGTDVFSLTNGRWL